MSMSDELGMRIGLGKVNAHSGKAILRTTPIFLHITNDLCINCHVFLFE